MSRRELLAITVVLLVVIGLPVTALGYQYWLRPELAAAQVIDIEMTIPEDRSFQPDFIEITAGEPVMLRFSSLDVTHGIAIGPGLDIDLGHIDPGKIVEITLSFDEPGVYTYYCNTWCSPNHWRMRGTIQVIDPTNPAALPAPVTDPAIEALIADGIDIDLAHSLDNSFPLIRIPSITRGETLTDTLAIPTEILDLEWQRTHTPADALDQLQAENPTIAQVDLVDAVAYLWQIPIDPAVETLYNKNCAACHGQYGAGDGPAAAHTVEDPIVFADPICLMCAVMCSTQKSGAGAWAPTCLTLVHYSHKRKPGPWSIFCGHFRSKKIQNDRLKLRHQGLRLSPFARLWSRLPCGSLRQAWCRCY